MINESSRYFPLAQLTYRAADGREIVYKARRLVPRTPTDGKTTLAQGERLDLVAKRTLGDPRLFWRLCDANEVLNPFDLEAASGRQLNLPEI